MTAEIRCEDLTRHYGLVKALDNFSHRFEPGRIHALMGKNGSGKSTLVKMINGTVQPTSGRILFNDQPVSFFNPSDAFAADIITVHQELSLVQELSITENIFLGRLPQSKFFGLPKIDWKQAHQDTQNLLEKLNIDLDPNTLISRLSIGQQQIVEIAKAMSFQPALLLLDEPTSALAKKEVDLLFRLLRDLKSQGVTMMYISHRMSELFEIADTATIVRDGKHIGSVEVKETNTEEIIEMMFGDTAHMTRPPRDQPIDKSTPVMEVRGLSLGESFQDVSFDLYEGEVLGIAGLLGAGRTELLRAIFGADSFDSGNIKLFGDLIEKPTPRQMKNKGVGYTPENRKEQGLVLNLSIHNNLCMASLDEIANGMVITKKLEEPYVDRQIKKLAIKIGSPHDEAGSLSGGNQQKIVIGNWLNTQPKVMFFDEPSRGVDVHAKQQIFKIMWGQAERGLSSVFVSSELEELLEVCDRILIMKEGHLLGERLPENTTLTELYNACMEGS